MKRKSIIIIIVMLIFFLGIFIGKLTDKDKSLVEAAKFSRTQSTEEKSVEDTAGEVYLMADTDLGKITTAAIVAQVDKIVEVTAFGCSDEDVIEIVGNDGMAEFPEKRDGKFKWIPKRSGRFTVNLIDEEGNKKTSRLIYVNGITDEDYYQLTDIVEKESEKGVTFSTSIFGRPVNSTGNEAQPRIGFTIGEEGIWSKTLRDYENDATSIAEGKDFSLDRGTYFIRAALRDRYSVEDEDAKIINYSRSGPEGHKVTVDAIVHDVVENGNSGQSDRFTVNAHCEDGCDLVYAFFISDSLGDKRMTESGNGYSESNVFTCPSTSWEYTVTVRVKHKQNADTGSEIDPLKLPDSYEAISTYIVQGEQNIESINFKNIQIEAFILSDYYKGADNQGKKTVQTIQDNTQAGIVYVHNNNYITINTEDDQNYQYEAWVEDDGIKTDLAPVIDQESKDKRNKFIYYPMSGGSSIKTANPNETHTLYVKITLLDKNGFAKRIVTKQFTLDVKSNE